MSQNYSAIEPYVNEFIKHVGGIYEVEYGDFKRKVGQYVIRLERRLQGAKHLNLENKKILKQMRSEVVYLPNADIEQTRFDVVTLAKKLI